MDANPNEIAKELRANKKRPFKSSTETIDYYRNQVLDLKLQLHKFQKYDFDQTKRDLLVGLVERNEELEKKFSEQLQRQERPKETKDSSCQTNLNLTNMEELLRASIILKRQNETEQGTAKKMTTNLATDEKDSLELLYRIDGNMTTALDKLRAKLDVYPTTRQLHNQIN